MFRLTFILLFITNKTGNYNDLFYALWIGLRFDMRLACFILIPIVIAFLIPIYNPLNQSFFRLLAKIYLKMSILIIILLYGFDLGNYSYLDQRIDISSLKLLENPLIAFGMAWESYPMVIILFILVIVVYFVWRNIDKTFTILTNRPKVFNFSQSIIGSTISGFIFIFAIWGTFRQYRLLWSDAHFSNDPFIVASAINPILYLNETRSFALEEFNEEKTRLNYDLMVKELNINIPNSKNLSFTRSISKRHIKDQPNIVVIFLESVGYNRMSRSGNPLNPTPNLDALSKNSIFFDRFYIPMVGTARSVFGLITGIHDVASVETASSNPRIVDQYSSINALDNYEKYYIMGGSASWRNVRSLLKNNIPDINIIEQDQIDYPRLDVWGISDNNLFKVAQETFENNNSSNPFFAIIQTATNHRPYSLPDDVDGFNIINVDKSILSGAGFDSQKQYNAMRMLDHTVGEFITFAKSSSYFDNTVFLFFGDHGTSDPRALHMPKSDFDLKLRSYQVPFFIYSPKIIKGGSIRSDVSQLVDILPTINGLAGNDYENRTMGRDLLNDNIPIDPLALIINKKMANQHIAVIGRNHYLSMSNDGTQIQLHELWSDEPLVDVKDIYPEITNRYSARLEGIYETAKYMLYHNQKIKLEIK
ncbi:MAG: sulfatase-like hydrolase/transferase [Candidatus Marinimicrobia bacterium]|nr:sulfatase-like hydrolase/transferase [Candidatus Neomarinimicrobiota bacterium]